MSTLLTQLGILGKVFMAPVLLVLLSELRLDFEFIPSNRSQIYIT